MGESFDKGDIIEVRTTKPLEAGSDINIRGVNADSPLVQLREKVIAQQSKEEALAKTFAKGEEALRRLGGQAYLYPQNPSDHHVSQNDMNVQLNTKLYQNIPQASQKVANIHKQVKEALDINKDGRVAIEEIQETAKRSGVRIDNMAGMTQMLNAGNNNNSLPQATPSGSRSQAPDKF